MVKYSEMANEDLLKLGTTKARDELLIRGNTLVVIDGKNCAEKTVQGSTLINQPLIHADDVVTIVNGKITAVNGNPYP